MGPKPPRGEHHYQLNVMRPQKGAKTLGWRRRDGGAASLFLTAQGNLRKTALGIYIGDGVYFDHRQPARGRGIINRRTRPCKQHEHNQRKG